MTSNEVINQLVFATVAGGQSGKLIQRLVADGFHITEVDSQGGILHESTDTLLIGLDKRRLPRLLKHIRECCRTRRQYLPAHIEAPILEIQPVMIEAEIGGATIYVFDVERYEQL
jgi:uncharacterized protein YaaQ